MIVVPFRVPQTQSQIFRLQKDTLRYFYDKLHQHSELQIMLIEQGEGTVIAGNFVGRFEPGDVFILGSRQPHVFRSDKVYYNRNQKQNCMSTSLYFNEAYFGDRFWNADEMKSVRLFYQRAQRGFKITGKSKSELAQHIKGISSLTDIERLTGFLTLLQKLTKTKGLRPLNKQPSPELAVESKRMNDILQFTFKESHRKIYISEVAEVAHLSPEAFCRYFKLRTRKTYTNFLSEVRVSNACKLLADRDKKIEQVCFETGFQNTSNFNRIFKKSTGLTPSRYAKVRAASV